MANIFEFEGIKPVIHPSSFVHPNATVTGNVIIGENVYIGPGAAIRGDWGEIVIENGCNVQENCTLHMFPGVRVHLKEYAHIGHGAVIHGAIIGRNSLVGMNAVVMDECEIGDECLIGALSFLKSGSKIAQRSMVIGNPAAVVKQVSDAMLEWKTKGTELYQKLAAQCKESLRPCAPLTEITGPRPVMETVYAPWRAARNSTEIEPE